MLQLINLGFWRLMLEEMQDLFFFLFTLQVQSVHSCLADCFALKLPKKFWGPNFTWLSRCMGVVTEWLNVHFCINCSFNKLKNIVRLWQWDWHTCTQRTCEKIQCGGISQDGRQYSHASPVQRCHPRPVRTWNRLLIKWRGSEFHLEYPGSSFFSNKLIFKLTQPKRISQSPFENLQLLFRHVWRGMSLKAETQTGLSLTWIPKVNSPPSLRCKNMGWPVLSEVVRPLYFIFLRLPSCLSNKGEANAGGLLNYERWAKVIPVIKSKEAGPKPHGSGILLCCCTLHLQKKSTAFGGKLSKQACFYFAAKITWAGQKG